MAALSRSIFLLISTRRPTRHVSDYGVLSSTWQSPTALEACLHRTIRNSDPSSPPRTGNQEREVGQNNTSIDRKFSWLERADWVGQVWGSRADKPQQFRRGLHCMTADLGEVFWRQQRP